MKKHLKILLFMAVMLFSFTACKPQENKGKSIVIDSENPLNVMRLHSPDNFGESGKFFQLMDCYEDRIVIRNNVSRDVYFGLADKTTDITVHNLTTGETDFTYTVEGNDVLVYGALLWENILYVSEFDIRTNYHNIYSYKNGVKTLIAENIGNYVSQFGPYYNPLVRTADGVFFEDQRFIGDDFIYRIMKAEADSCSEYYSMPLSYETAPYGLKTTGDGRMSFIVEDSVTKLRQMYLISENDVQILDVPVTAGSLRLCGDDLLCIEKDGEESFFLKIRDKNGEEKASMSFFGVGDLVPVDSTSGYVTITTYSQPADNNCYLYIYYYNDGKLLLNPVYNTGSFNMNSFVIQEDGKLIILQRDYSEGIQNLKLIVIQ